jgi:hypothetical protein
VPVVAVEAFEERSRRGICDSGDEFWECGGRGFDACAMIAGVNFDEDTNLDVCRFDGGLKFRKCI